jgi:DNA-binding CsgD family transcriptional regulator
MLFNITALTVYEIDKIYKYANLKPKEREFFDLRNEGLTYEQIAEELDMSVNGVKKFAKKVYTKCIRTLCN